MVEVKKLFIAVKAMIVHDGKVLLIRESGQYQDGTNVGKYDVPGGRLKPAESLVEGLQREVKEETDIDVEVGRPFFADEWQPRVSGELWQVVGIYFFCRPKTSAVEVALSKEHDDFQWLAVMEALTLPLLTGVADALRAFQNIEP